MKSLITLLESLINELGAQCGTVVDQDVRTVLARFEHEGESFITITLPTYAKAFEQALAAGSIASVTFDRWSKRGGHPLFLGGITRLVFSADDGSLLADPSIDAIRGIRQVCLVFSKIFEVCDPRRAAASVDGYVECERMLDEYWYPPELLRELRATATQVFGSQLRDLEELCLRGALVPRHGPGATADRLAGNHKFDLTYWPVRLDASFPVADYALAGYSHEDVLDRVSMPEPGAELPVRVITVPKTAAKARVIAMEPCAMQYAQQALLREFMRVFSKGSRFVDLADQEPNRLLARVGSEDGSLATLDLSEASDRVTVEVVEAVFGNYPNLLAALTNSRSLTSSLPDGRVMRLSKFASMGSATCFPVESIVFATAALLGIRRALGTSSWSDKALARFASSTRVFGDDIIVPARYVHNVIDVLVAIAAKPNAAKSFWTGMFRESCGSDNYAGADVSVVRLRQRLPRSHRDSSELLSLISFRNQLYMGGWWETVRLIDEELAVMRIPMPIVEPSSPVKGRTSVCFRPQVQRHHPDYQSPLVKGIVVKTVSPSSESSDHGKLLKCLLPGRIEPFADGEHLTRSGRPDNVRTKVGWGAPV